MSRARVTRRTRRLLVWSGEQRLALPAEPPQSAVAEWARLRSVADSMLAGDKLVPVDWSALVGPTVGELCQQLAPSDSMQLLGRLAAAWDLDRRAAPMLCGLATWGAC
jgi:hypothetical protein